MIQLMLHRRLRRLVKYCADSVIDHCVVPALHRTKYYTAPVGTFDWRREWSFVFRCKSVNYFFHHHNCGWPPLPCTERVVELGIADLWLSRQDSTTIFEVGAVTPYYWPGRVGHIIDPTDSHPCISCQESIFDVDLSGHNVLSISTIEHIGMPDYGLPTVREDMAIDALYKIINEANEFLVSIPVGYNLSLDGLLFNDDLPRDVEVTYMRRATNVEWIEVENRDAASLAYGPYWTNGLVIISRGWNT